MIALGAALGFGLGATVFAGALAGCFAAGWAILPGPFQPGLGPAPAGAIPLSLVEPAGPLATPGVAGRVAPALRAPKLGTANLGTLPAASLRASISGDGEVTPS